MKVFFLVLVLLGGSVLSACRQAKDARASSPSATRAFAARGVIQEMSANGGTAVIRHEAIPGYMPAMTMELTARPARQLDSLRPGDAITFRLVVNEEEHWIENIRRAAGAKTTLPAPVPLRVAPLATGPLNAGDVLPDLTLLGESGQPVKLSDFSGKALAFTFIFTRCPLPDFCPRMNRQFQGARKLLQARANGPANWQLLSLSFDPEHDQPEVLARHARVYRGPDTDRWRFAVIPANALASFAAQVDFHFMNDGGSLTHNLRTVVLDPNRRIHRQFTGNQWTAEELAEALVEAARVKTAD